MPVQRPSLYTSRLADHEEEWIPLNLPLEEASGGLATLSSHLIAVLNKKSSAGLAKLQEIAEDVKYLSYAHRNQLHAGLEKLQTSTGIVQFDLDIMVIGPESESEEIAGSLSAHNLYLQELYFILEQYPYRNPQYLDIEHYEQQPSLDTEQCLDHRSQDQNVDTSEPSHLELILAAIDNLPGNSRLGPAPVDSRIQTPPLEYIRPGSTTPNPCNCPSGRNQSKAVDFIIGSENGDHTKVTSLRKETEEGRSSMQVPGPMLPLLHFTHYECRFQHVITGSKSPSPDDVRGGLLAGEMGLGKTLSMISAVVTAMSCAESYAKSTQTRSGVTPTLSTLVIVPFSRKPHWYQHQESGKLTAATSSSGRMG